MRRNAAEAGGLVWRTAPALTVCFGLTTLVEAVAPVTVAWLTKSILDRLVGDEPIAALAAALAATGVVVALVPQLGRFLSNDLGRRVGLGASQRLFTATDRFVGLAPFENPSFLDRLRLAQQGVSATGNLVTGVFGLGRGAVSLIGFVAALTVINPVVTVVVVVAALPSLFAEFGLSRNRAGVMWQIAPHQRREFFYGQLLSTVEAAKEIRLFNLGSFLLGRMLGERGTADAAERRMDRKDLLTHAGLEVLGALVTGGAVVWALLAARRSQLTIGDVSMFIIAVAGVRSALGGLIRDAAGTHQRLLMFGHFTGIVHSAPDLPVAVEPVALQGLQGSIELRDVWFRYSDDHPWILRGVDLTIPHGAAVALVGLNGAGKSTVVKLLCRLYDPTRGTIVWDGTDLRDVDPARLRERIGAVFQDHMAYDFTAADNIAVGDLTALDDLDRISAAAVRAGAHDKLAALPGGYGTMLTRMFAAGQGMDGPDTGVMLSGGQWQRVALARAFLRDGCDLMILDEPSSGLDPEAEHDVHERMLKHRADRTSLLISHRLNAVREADRIAVLDDGVITELGGHDELLEAGGVYARLFKMQANGYTS
jgi:ATP-binding cassette subfamily B protein